MNARELGTSPTSRDHAGGVAALVHLDPDHPGFRDPVYRERRNTIARIALEHETGTPVAHAPYSSAEHAVWAQVCAALAPLHQERACTEILQLQEILPLDPHAVPQLAALNPRLHAVAGFRMEPVAGMVSARTFLTHLGKRVFLSTQYIRHASSPFYTPEPDVIHELVGHAATLVHPGIAELNRVVGEAAMAAEGISMERLERVYWYTLEFGLVAEGSGVKAFGAGLLSSVGELERCTEQATLRAWDLEAIAGTPYDPTGFQDVLFVAPSFTRMLCDVTAWVRTGGHHPAKTHAPAG
ncbi:MAG: phenylalanine 4-monooxygenase [Deltaproteobacteria bacterium]|nr:phenylalanine 4-monooxygenase [Deltaproteobacteria bacterium]HCH63025.1 phenylalanine 4-monooxygenase [Deltaproteobacteria bacterium]